MLDALVARKEELLDCCLIHDLSANLDSLMLRYHDTPTAAAITRTGSLLLGGLVLFRIMNDTIRDFLVKGPKLHHEESISILQGEALRE